MDDVPQNQSEFAEVEEKIVQALIEEPHETMKTNSEVETTKELMEGNLGPRDGKRLPMFIEIAGEENSSSSQVYNDKEITNGANRGNSSGNLIAEEDLKNQEVEVTIIEVTLPGTQSNAEEESRDLNRDGGGCIVQEETIMDSQEATSAQTTGIKYHHPDSTQDINLETAKLLETGNKGAGPQKTFNSSTASFEDLHKAGLLIKREKDLAISSILGDKRMEPQGLNSSLNPEDETTEEVQRLSDCTRNYPSGIDCKSDHPDMAKENSQDVEVLPQSVNLKDESTEKIENLSDFLRNVSAETECGSSHRETTEENTQEAEMLPLSVIVGHEMTKEVESLSEHTGNISTERDCGKEHSETTVGNPQDAERLLQSINMEMETTKKEENSSNLAENVSIEIENGTDNRKMTEGTFEGPKILDETTEKLESLSKHTGSVSTETEGGGDPSKVTKENIQDAEILSHSEVEDKNIEKVGSLSGLARNASIETGGGNNYIEAAKEEISKEIEILLVSSLINPSMTGTSTLDTEPGETSCEVKSIDDSEEKEILLLKRSDIVSANANIISSGSDCLNKHEKEDVENGSHAEHVSSPLVNALTGEILLKDGGPEMVQEIEAHSGTVFGKKDGDTEDASCIESSPAKEVSNMVPIVAKENQAEVGNQDKCLEDLATVKSTESATGKHEERPEFSSNDLLMERRETLEKESQEQVLLELLAGEDRLDKVSNGLTEANVEAEVPVKPQIFNTEKDLEAFLPKNEPGKENHNDSKQAASMPLEKIESSQHFERTTSVQEQKSTECLEGGLCEEKDSKSDASKIKAENSLQENITLDDSTMEVDSAVLNDTAQGTYETGQCPESTIFEELSKVESSIKLRSTTEGDKHENNDLIDIEDNTQEKDGVSSGKEENLPPQSRIDNKRKQVEDLSVGNNKSKCPKAETDYINDHEEIRGNDSEEAASELKQDHIVVEEVQKDTFSKDEEREAHIIAEEQIVTENSVESSAAENNKSDHKVIVEAANPEAKNVCKLEAIYSNDDEEIKGRGSDEGVPELKEDHIVAKEVCMDTLCKDEEKETQTIDKEVVKEYLVEHCATEEKKSHQVKTKATNPEDVNKVEAFYRNDNEEIKGHDSAEGAPELEEDHLVAQEAYKDTCSKDEEKEAEKIDKEEIAAEHLKESSVAGKYKSDHQDKTEATNPEGDDIHKGEAAHNNDDEKIKAYDSAEGAPKLKEYQILAEELCKDTFNKDDGKETQVIDKKEPTAEYSVESSVREENKITEKKTNPEPAELHKGKDDHHKDDEETEGNDSEEEATKPKEDQLTAKEIHRDTFSQDEEKKMQIINKEEVTTEYLIEASVAGKSNSDHEATNHEADDAHKREAVYRNDDEDIKGNDSAEGALELKEHQISAEQVDRDTFRKDDKKETQIIDKEDAATELVDSSFKDENQYDHEVKSEAANPEADEVQGKEDHLNDHKHIEGNYTEEVAPEPKEYRIAAEEKHKDTFSKDDEKAKQIIDEQEVTAQYLVESSGTEENKYHHKLKTEPINPEADDVHKQEAFHSQEGAQEQKEDQIIGEEAHKDTFSKGEEKGPQIINKEVGFHKQEAFYSRDDEKMKGIHSQEGAPEQKGDQIIWEEAHKDTFSKGEEKGPQIIDKEVPATEHLVESSVAAENKTDQEVVAEVTNPEAHELHKGRADHLNGDEESIGHDSEAGATKPKEHQIAAEEATTEMFCENEEKEACIIEKEEVATEYLEEFSVAEDTKSDNEVTTKVHKETFCKIEEKEPQIIEKKEVATEYLEDFSIAEDNKSDNEVITRATDPEADYVHKGEAVYRYDDDIEGNLEEAAPELKDQSLGEAYKDTFSKGEEKDTQIVDKEVAATEYLGESHAAEENKSDHDITTKATNPEGNELDKATTDQIIAEEVMQVHEDTFCKDADKGTQIIEEKEVATEYLVESYVAEENKSDPKVINEATNPEADDVYKREAVYRNDDEEIKCIDSEEGAPKLKEDQILTEEACKDKEKDAQIIERAEEYLVESSVAEENEFKAEATNLEAAEFHEGKSNHPNDEEVIQGNDPEEVAPEPNENEIAAKEVYEDASSKDVEKETQAIDKEKVVTECLAESLVAETEKSDHKVTNQQASSVHYSAENTDPVEEKKTQNELPESVLEDIIAEDFIMTQVSSPEKAKEEFEPEHDFATTSTKEMKDSCEETRKGELDREKIPQHHDIEKQFVKEADSSNNYYTKSMEGEIVQENFQEEEANKQKSAEAQMNIEEILNLAIPIPMQGERSVEGSLKEEEWDVIEPEKETKDVDIEGTAWNDKATYTTQEGEKVTVKHKGNADVTGYTAGTVRLAEGLGPSDEYQEQAENSSAVPKNSAKNNETMLDTTKSAEIQLVEGSLKRKDWDDLEPQKRGTKDADIGDTSNNNEKTHSAHDGEMETVKHEGKADVSGDTIGLFRLAEGWPPREDQEQAENFIAAPEISERSKEEMLHTNVPTEIRSMERRLKQEEQDAMTPKEEKKDLDREGTIQKDEATLSSKDTIKHEGNPDAAGTNGLTEEFPAREYQELVENSSALPDISEERNEKKLDTKESTEIRPVEGTLKQEVRVATEQEKEAKYLHVERTALIEQEGQEEMFKLEGNPDAAGTHRLIGSPAREYQELAKNSTVEPNICEERNEIKLDIMESKEAKDLDREGTTQKDEATLSTKEGEKDAVKHKGNLDAEGTNGLTEELPAREDQKLAENSTAGPEISKQGKDKMLDTAEEETKELDREGTKHKDEATLSAKEGDKDTVKNEGNLDTAGTDGGLTEDLSAREYQEFAENSSMVLDISEERNEKMLDIRELTEIRLVEGILKQKEWEVIETEKETKHLHAEGTTQNDEATHSAQQGKKEMIRKEGNVNAAGTNRLGEEFLPREHQELAENSGTVPEISEKSKENMLNIMESTEIIRVEESSKQEEWYVIELGKETRDLDRESTAQNDEATLSAHEGEKEMVKHEGNPDAAFTDMITKGLPPIECQELPENSSAVPEIFEDSKEEMLDLLESTEIIQVEENLKEEEWDVMEPEKQTKDERNEIMLNTTESIEIKPVEGSSKQEEWDVMDLKMKTRDVDREATTKNKEAMLSAQEGENETVKHEGNLDTADIDGLTEGLPPIAGQKLAENSNTVPDISEERNETMLDTAVTKEIQLVEESSKKEEWDAMKPEKETKDLVREGTTQKDDATLSTGGEIEREIIMHEGNLDTLDIDRLTEELPPIAGQKLAENSNTVPDISEERNETMLDTAVTKKIQLVEESSKKEEWDAMKPEKETKDLVREGTAQKDDATLSTGGEVEREIIMHEGNLNTPDIDRPTKELPPIAGQKLAENSNTVPDISEERNETMLDTAVTKEIQLVEESSKKEEWDAMKPEKETKDLVREGTAQKDDATLSTGGEVEREIIMHEGNLNTPDIDRPTKELPPIAGQKLAENSNAVPDISEERNETMLDTAVTKKIQLVEESSKQEEWDVMKPEKETKDLDREGTTEELPPIAGQKLAENSNTVPDISEERNETMLDTAVTKEIQLVEESSKKEEWDAMKPEKETKDLVREGTAQKDDATLSTGGEVEREIIMHEGNLNTPDIDRPTKELPPIAGQKHAENSNTVLDISEERNETMLDTAVTKKILLVEESSKQEEWDVMKPEKETKDLDIEGTTQKDEATLLIGSEGEKEIIMHGGNSDAASTNRLTEEWSPRVYQELDENSSVVAHTYEERNKKMADTIGSTEIILVEGFSKQEEWDVMEPKKETKDLHIEGATQNDEATYSVQEAGKKIVKHGGNTNAAGVDRLAEELPQRQYQKLSENSSAVHEISEKGKVTMLDSMESTKIRPIEGSLRQEEWNVIKPKIETKNLGDGMIDNDEATHSAQGVDRGIVKHEGNSDAVGDDRLTAVLPPREYQELAENSSVAQAPNISEEGKEKMLEITDSTVIIPIEGSLKQDEWDILEPENETKNLGDDTIDDDEATRSAQGVDKEMVKHEGNSEAVGDDRLTAVLPPREYQELTENSSVAPDISEEGKEKMLEITDSTVVVPIEGSLKQDEWDVIQPENETKNLGDGTIDDDEATRSAKGVDKEMVIKHEGNSDAVGDVRLTAVLSPREYQELAENASVAPDISEEGKEKMLEITDSTVIVPIEVSLKQDEWDVKEPENETKNLGDGTIDDDEATRSAQEVTVKHEGNSDAVGDDRLTAVLPPREYQELAENASVAPDISEEGKEKMLEITDSTVIIPIEGSFGEWDELEPEKKTKDGDTDCTTMNDEVSEKSKKKMLDNMEPTEIVVIGDTKEVKLQENMQRDNNTPTPEKTDQDDASKPEVIPRSKKVEISEFIKNSSDSAKMSSKDETIGEPCQDSILEEARNVKETTRISELQEADGNSHSGNMNIEVEILYETEQVQFSAETAEIKLYKEDILTRKGENEDGTFQNEDEKYDDKTLELEPTKKELQVENEDFQDAFAFFVVPETRGLKQAAVEVKLIDECREIPESKVEVPKQEILPKDEARANQDPFNDSCIETVSDLEIKAKTGQITNSGTKPLSGDKKLQLLQEGSIDKILEATDVSNAVEGAKGEEHIENVKTIADSQGTTDKFGSTTLAESSQSDLQQPTKEPQQQQGVREAQNQNQNQNLHGFSDINRSTLVIDTKDASFCAASDNDANVPLEMKKLTPEEAETKNTTDSKNMQLQQESTTENFETVGENLEPSKVKSKDASHGEEKGTQEEATLTSMPREAISISLSYLLEATKEDVSQVTHDFPSETEANVEKKEMKKDLIKTDEAQHEEPKSDEEGEGDEDNRKLIAYDSPVKIEAPSDIDIRAARKKSHNILSGVKSKVKHSIKKVKKAITGKSCRPSNHHQNKM